MTKWGLVATIKAKPEAILDFAAHHLDLGAHRLYLFLDAPCPEVLPLLKAHPKIRVTTCDDAYWKKLSGYRPKRHQARQGMNATRTYQRPPEVDWLAHIDVDEFLWPADSVAAQLAALPESVQSARMLPLEGLGGSRSHFRARIPGDDATIAARLYPEFGHYLKGGFVSHVAGKVFARTGRDNVEIRIHNMFRDGEKDDSAVLPGLDLCHCHSGDWEKWRVTCRFRMDQGSYRAGLKPARSFLDGGLTLYQVLSTVDEMEGETGLRRFYDEACADTPERRKAFEAEGLLRLRDLALEEKRQRHFPQWRESVAKK